jgi:small-conductance mechanosensitive channel
VVTNYNLPERRAMVLVPISVSCEMDADRVEEVLIEEAVKAASEVPGVLNDPAPSVRFVPGFGASSLDFTLACHVREITDQVNVKHQLNKRIWKRFKLEHIDIPYPTRTVYLKGSEKLQQ